ncbi:MAG: WYL domain-containing protein [Clostridiales bacterium]|nr:WYL domain-containing protein [Clostridiales bacterium]
MKSEGQKMKLFALKEILETETDADHGIDMKRILELLSMRGIKAERKSVYDDLRTFRDSDILDVTEPQGKNREYSVASRTFELSELKMMIDAIQASKFLSEAKTRELIRKLETLCSKHEAYSLQRHVVIANRVKSSSKSLFRNVDTLHAAMSNGVQVSYKYFNYGLDKSKIYRKGGERYCVSPWAMIYADDNYYLLAWDTWKFKHFRVDRMEDVQLTAFPREAKEEFEKIDMSAYTKYTFSMYGGNITPVTMVFENDMAGAVMDRFGSGIMTQKEDENHFRITVNVAVSGQFFGWVFGLGKKARIIAPESVKEQMKSELLGVGKNYD